MTSPLKKSTRNNIIKVNSVRSFVKKYDKQISKDFVEEFNNLVMDILMTIILDMDKNRKRLSLNDIKKVKKKIKKCLEESKGK